MSVSADLLKKAMSPFTKVKKESATEKCFIDLHAFSKAIIDDMSSQEDTDDVEKSIESLTKRVSDLDTFLDNVSEDEDGNAYVIEGDVDTTLLEKFMIKPKKNKQEKSETPEPASEETQEEPEETEVEKSEDGWEKDMAPKRPPVLRSARLTKRERPISAQKGARKGLGKYQKARDKSFNRTERGEERCMS